MRTSIFLSHGISDFYSFYSRFFFLQRFIFLKDTGKALNFLEVTPVSSMFSLNTYLFFFFFLRWSLTLLPRLMCSGTVSAHCNLHSCAQADPLPSASQVAGITGVCHYTWLIFVFLVEMGFHRVGQLLSNFLPQVIYLPWPPKVQRLQA